MSSNHNRMSPRQRMINLMYLVLTAMLALNVSSNVLDGVSQVDRGLLNTNKTLGIRNEALLGQIAEIARINPAKAAEAAQKASHVALMSDRILFSIDSLKLAIARQADGKDARLDNIRHRENLNAASVVMLSPTSMAGRRLRLDIDSYRERISGFITDSVKSGAVKSALSTARIETADGLVDWETAKFEHQPVIASLTQLTKLQCDILHAEGEALTSILDGIDAADLRVNRTGAFIIPRSDVVMQGGVYEADIVLAAVDSTSRPTIEVNGNALPSGSQIYKAVATTPGPVTYRGLMKVTERDGSVRELPFEGHYDVIEPTATVSATMMNIMYAGIANPIKVSVPGVIDSNVTVDVTGGRLEKNGKTMSVRPDNGVDQLAVSVKARIDDRVTEVAKTVFKVRPLPAPMPFVRIDKGRYNGGIPAVQRRALLASPGIGAAIDDGVLDIGFDVVSFETIFFDSMGNAIPEKSDGSGFSARQKEQIKRLRSGSRFFITGVRAKGPDGVVRQISPIEVILN